MQAHAVRLASESREQTDSVAMQSQSYQAKARSLEAAANAQHLQAEACGHAQMQAEATAKAEQCVWEAERLAAFLAATSAQHSTLGFNPPISNADPLGRPPLHPSWPLGK